ncbi:MAG: ABC transporter permease [Blastocatellia bacterium]
MQTLWQDLRYGARMLLKNPGFTLIAVVTLSLGIGANTALFSVIDAVLFRPLPFERPERLVTLRSIDVKRGEGLQATYPDFNDWRAQNQSFEKLAAFRGRDLMLTGWGEAARVRGAVVTSDLFPLLGVAPRLGRGFTTEEDRAGGHSVVLSHAAWRDRFNADENVVGRTVTLNGLSYQIAGVMPAGFAFPLGVAEPAELWISAGIDDEGRASLTRQRGNHAVEVIGRLRDGVGLAQAQAEMGRIAQGLEQQYADTNTGLGVRVVPFHERLVGNVSWALWLLFGAVGCVLLIACANVANLLLARAVGRQREMAVRAALGAPARRIVRQLLTESLALALSGGLAGLLLAWWGAEWLVKLAPAGLPRATETTLDPRVFGFTLFVSVLTGLLFGLVPAWQAAKPDVTLALKESGRGAGGGSSDNRLRQGLVVAQVAVAFVLLTGAGLLLHSFRKLQRVDPGFDPRNLLTFRLSLPAAKYGEPQQIETFHQQLQERLRALPGVTNASASTVVPLTRQNASLGFSIEGAPVEPNRPFPHESFYRIIRPGYLQTMGISLVAGRDFDARDTREANQVVIINETLARRHFPNQNPLGRRINPSFATDSRGILWREIAGVVKDVRHAALNAEGGAECYVPHQQAPFGNITIVMRASREPNNLIDAVRAQVRALDRDLPVYNIKTLDEYLALSVAQQRFQTLLLAIFAGLALLLVAVGLYGVMAYSVAQRTHELGLRVALGAQTRDVLRLVVAQGLGLTVAGVMIGVAGALALTRLLRTLLYDVSATNPSTFIGVAALLMMVALVACWIPARRATQVDPLVALRVE